jgi:Holliday junction DNA helicase RuvA
MISYLKGTLIKRSPNEVIIEVGGVGFGIFVPLSVFYRLPEEGKEVHMYVCTYLQKEQISLYGFLSAEERDLFEVLLTVRGIGPKMALNLLSGMEMEDLKSALIKGDKERLCKIPGIGPKTAERMIFELKDKLTLEKGKTEALPPHFEDTLLALMKLGYTKKEAKRALQRVIEEKPALSIEELLKEALRRLYEGEKS